MITLAIASILAILVMPGTLHAQSQGAARRIPLGDHAIIFVGGGLGAHEEAGVNSRIPAEIDYLEYFGYRVALLRDATQDQILNALARPDVKAMSYFGHGGVKQSDGTVLPSFGGSTVAKDWSIRLQQKLYSTYLNQGMLPRQAYDQSVKRSQNFNLRLVRNFSCNSLADSSLARLFVAPGGRYYGAKGIFTTTRLPEEIARTFQGTCLSDVLTSELILYTASDAKNSTERPTPGRTCRDYYSEKVCQEAR